MTPNPKGGTINIIHTLTKDKNKKKTTTYHQPVGCVCNGNSQGIPSKHHIKHHSEFHTLLNIGVVNFPDLQLREKSKFRMIKKSH